MRETRKDKIEGERESARAQVRLQTQKKKNTRAPLMEKALLAGVCRTKVVKK
jgi:hypothetical protein